MSVRMTDRTETELAWAARVAEELLAPLDERWRHTLTVVARTRAFRGVLSGGDLETLRAAAYLHDVGYAPALAQTGFYPLDGARFVRAAGHERLAALVAYHSAAQEEAEELGLDGELNGFVDEGSLLARALTDCDLTTVRTGRVWTCTSDSANSLLAAARVIPQFVPSGARRRGLPLSFARSSRFLLRRRAAQPKTSERLSR